MREAWPPQQPVSPSRPPLAAAAATEGLLFLVRLMLLTKSEYLFMYAVLFLLLSQFPASTF